MEDGVQLTPPPAAARLFGDHLALAERYAAWLATAGVERGLIGPREVPRLWDRHLLNCGVVQEVLPERATVADVGSGAGLPGLVLALARPDLRVTLVEPLLRRAEFLSEVVADLELDGIEVVRSRAEDLVDRSFDVVTSRAVAPLPRLLGWCVPLARIGGVVAAMKGSSAVQEIDAIPHSAWFRSGLGEPELLSCGAGLVDPQVTVVRVERVRRARVRLSGRGGSDAPPGTERSATRRRSRRPGR